VARVQFSLEVALRVAAWAGGIVGAIVAYELLRASVLRRIRLRMERSVSQYLARHRVRLDRFKFTHKHYIREALLADPALNEFMVAQSRTTGTPVTELSLRAEEYIEEIVPYFNLVSYYKLGYGIARPLMKLLYDVEFSRSNLASAEQDEPDGTATVYVMNHRSNADYVLFAVCMSRQVALSYAVGEWARVWPLETLFKSFGSYFVRRGEKDPLYHRTLQRYVQLVTEGGLTQGIFIEGGLSRDGRFRSPKTGLLDSLLGVTEGGGDVRFVPVGLNFDRVLEDRNLLKEADGATEAPDAVAKVRSLAWLLFAVPRAVFARLIALFSSAWTLARRRFTGFGVAAVHAGPPISMREFFGDELDSIRDLDRKQRRVALERFAAELMTRIGREVPVTAVPLAAEALERAGAFEVDGAGEVDVIKAIGALLVELRAAGAPVLLGPGLADLKGERAALEDEASGSGRPLLDLTADMISGEEAEAIWSVARSMLGRRDALVLTNGRVTVRSSHAALVRYYSGSLQGHETVPG
jgi:glycerol-3-phosphate O-acyltransferase